MSYQMRVHSNPLQQIAQGVDLTIFWRTYGRRMYAGCLQKLEQSGKVLNHFIWTVRCSKSKLFSHLQVQLWILDMTIR